jgi:hypothetical protein
VTSLHTELPATSVERIVQPYKKTSCIVQPNVYHTAKGKEGPETETVRQATEPSTGLGHVVFPR